tara:strand:- start:317 stop:445 length:129 start_codon:yes stop_codon:yes gene_type:complete
MKQCELEGREYVRKRPSAVEVLTPPTPKESVTSPVPSRKKFI